MTITPPTLDEIRAAAADLAPYILQTPVHLWQARDDQDHLPEGAEVLLKLELFQKSGSFKVRGALTNMLRLTDAERARGVTAVSAGNHAIAVACAAAAFGVDAKVVMLASANAARIERARSFGAEVVIGGTAAESFALVEQIAKEEGRVFIHPFDGEGVALGTGTLGLEFVEQAGPFDAVVVPVGGGGLMSGVSTAVKALLPGCDVFGVEPFGADSLSRSMEAGEPVTLERVDSIADSLGAPMALPYSFELCRQSVDEVVRISDDEMRAAMRLLFADMKLAVEPAGAAATAAIMGPLKERLAGRRIGVIVCGTNIDPQTYCRLINQP